MPVEATSSSASASITFTPAGDDPPKVEDKKSEEKKQIDQNAAAKTDAPATQKRDVVVFAVKVTRDGSGRDAAQMIGAGVLGTMCGTATKLALDGAAVGLGPAGKAAASVGSSAAGFVVGLGCAPAGSRAGGAVYDAATGGPNKIEFEAKTIQVEVPTTPASAAKPESAKADAAKPSSNSPRAPVEKQSQPAASKPSAAPAPNASTLPYTPAPAPAPASSAWTDPSASYLRPAAAK
jgi:hypothetical protein